MSTVELTLPPEVMDALAEQVREQVLEEVRSLVDGASDDRWLDSAEAAAYLGMSPNALHKLTAARAIPFEQASAGARCYFKRSELDAWRRGE
jgi:excisionase family DNA binding protein